MDIRRCRGGGWLDGSGDLIQEVVVVVVRGREIVALLLEKRFYYIAKAAVELVS